jgi:ribose 5-phosphate isomerase A
MCVSTTALSADSKLRAQYKKSAAERAVDFVQTGMIVGLGTGTTATYATQRIAHLLREGKLKGIVGIATSKAIREEAQRLGIPMIDEELMKTIDVTIDGADEIDPDLHLIKGGGGALLREKIVAQASSQVIIVADDSKLSPRLGTHHVLPVEVLAFGWRSQFRYLVSLKAQVKVRHNADGSLFITDSGNMILDCSFGPVVNPVELASALNRRAGIVAHGLFLGLATDVIIAGRDGVHHLIREA